MKTKLLFLSLILILVITTGFGCAGNKDPEAEQAILENINLTIWGLFDSSSAFQSTIVKYQLIHPNVKINYTKLRWEDYEKKLIEGWANNTGPDIFVVHNTWVGKYENKILPMPASIKLPFVTETGTLRKERVATMKTLPTLTSQYIKDNYPDVVYDDVVKNNEILGLPLSIDSLALFYNKDHFNAANITTPPKTWQELIEVVKKLTQQNEDGEIARSAIALGGAQNINRSNDILSLLMLQNGTQMLNASNQISFNKSASYDRNFYPGEQALRFYTDFALPSKEVYTWNTDLPEAVELFSAGKLSMMFGFSYQIPQIRAQAPKINFGIAPMTHVNLDGTDALGLPVNWANYWIYTVFERATHPAEAWDFLNTLATKTYQTEENKIRYYVEDYISATQNPPALRNLINDYKTNYPEQALFADQILTAQNWYHGKDPNHMNTVFKQMISEVIAGSSKLRDIITKAARIITQTY
ncbi:extracellular solute-binding protein [Candidatus Parcubacteria bacterium]|nr:extracellular solute-binding protein [Patescibacteria group bacterium]MBU4482309.1 extracellular solute-binding protein [Patescibacteria group bacterium]MCG2686861.1 extracellular solute-binding protein [Candidatus Parcubacteria bacterium]